METRTAELNGHGNVPSKSELATSPFASKTQVQRQENESLPTYDLTGENLPNLNNAKELPFDLMADYWTPENEGESKRMFFDKIGIRDVADQESGEVFQLECAYFLEQQANGELKPISNGSRRLVGAITANNIKRGTALQIKYLGKKKNATNQFKSDQWSIKPLIVNI